MESSTLGCKNSIFMGPTKISILLLLYTCIVEVTIGSSLLNRVRLKKDFQANALKNCKHKKVEQKFYCSNLLKNFFVGKPFNCHCK